MTSVNWYYLEHLMYYHTPFPLKESVIYTVYIYTYIYIYIYKNIHLARQYLLPPQSTESTYKQSVWSLVVNTNTVKYYKI